MTLEAELRAQIVANPSDDQLRRVYSDLLSDRGDARGEFISLQLAAAEGRLDEKGIKRMRDLERAHWREWLAPLDQLVDRFRFERGFLASCTLGNKVVPRDAWNTALDPQSRFELVHVSELDLHDDFTEPIATELLPALPRLTRLVVGYARLRNIEHRVDTLGVRVDSGPEARHAMGLIPRDAPTELRLISSDLLQLANVSTACLQRMQALPTVTQRLAFETNGASLIVSRDAKAQLSILELTVTKTHVRRLLVTFVPHAFGALPDLVPTKLVVHGPLVPRDRRMLAEAVRRFRHMQLLFA